MTVWRLVDLFDSAIWSERIVLGILGVMPMRRMNGRMGRVFETVSSDGDGVSHVDLFPVGRRLQFFSLETTEDFVSLWSKVPAGEEDETGEDAEERYGRAGVEDGLSRSILERDRLAIDRRFRNIAPAVVNIGFENAGG